jgi:hypothetical protein
MQHHLSIRMSGKDTVHISLASDITGNKMKDPLRFLRLAALVSEPLKIFTVPTATQVIYPDNGMVLRQKMSGGMPANKTSNTCYDYFH